LVTAACGSKADAITDSDEIVGKGETSAGGSATGTATSTSPSTDPVVASLANIGDSISQGFDADDSEPLDLNELVADPTKVFHDMPDLSWIQGTDARIGSVFSHYRASNAALVESPVSHSGAELVGKGSAVPNLVAQAQQLADKSPQLVYVLLGGNDVCNRDPAEGDDATANMYSVDEWRAGVQAGLAALVQALPAGATVRFLSMPRVDMLVDQVGTSPAPMKMSSSFGDVDAHPTCQSLWVAAKAGGRAICPIVTLESDADRRKQIGARIDQYNDALATEVRSWNGDATRNPKKLTLQSDWHGSIDAGQPPNTSVGTFVLESELVSKRDCFHPSIRGQQQMASMVLQTSKFTTTR
jgi:lysophospholipase L1-like esterase